jgi:HK97 family phage major capsid protein
MKPEELKGAVEEAVKPLGGRIGLLEEQNKNLKKALEDAKDENKPIADRIAAIEKALAERKAPEIIGLTETIEKARKEGRTDEQFSFARLAKAQLHRSPKYAPFEERCIKEFAKLADYEVQKDLSTDVDTAGGTLVPTQSIPQVIELLRAKEIVRALGATVMGGLRSSPIEIPKITGASTGYWVGEGAEITPSQITTGMVTGQTRKCAAISIASRELIQQGPGADAIINQDLARVLALAVDLAAFKGTGAGNQPKGIANWPGVGTSSLASCTPEKLMTFLLQLENANADEGNIGWAFSPTGWDVIRKLKDANNQYYLRPDLAMGEKKSLLGYPVKSTTQLSAGDAIVGNFADMLILEWGGMEFRASEETYDAFKKVQVWLRALTMTDIVIRRGASFVYVSDLAA